MGKGGIKIFVFRCVAIVLSLLAGLLFLEVILRIRGPKYYRFNNRDYEYYTNPRGYHIPIRKENGRTVYSLIYRIDSEGRRLSDTAPFDRKQKDNLILGLGDSFTHGRSVKYDDIYLTILEKLLDQNGYNIGILNCGRVATDLEEIFSAYLIEASKKDYPLVIYGFVLNDFGLPGRDKIVGFDLIDINNRGYKFNRFRKISSLYNFIWYLIEKKALHEITIKAYHDAFKGDYAKEGFSTLKQLNQYTKLNNSELVIVLFPLLYDFDNYPFREIHAKIHEFCYQENIPLLDLLPAFSEYRAEELWANPTDHHPNETAHRIVAKELYTFLKQNQLI